MPSTYTPKKGIPSPKTVSYILYCHGSENPETRIVVPYYGSNTFKLNYYVQCGISLWGGLSTLESICNYNTVPTLTVLSGNITNDMYFTGDEMATMKNTMGIYLCDGVNHSMILWISPQDGYDLLGVIWWISQYHSANFDNTIRFSIEIHTCRAVYNAPVSEAQGLIDMNPDTFLAESFQKSTNINDTTPENYLPPRKLTALRKTLQQRKVESDMENFALQRKIDEITDTLKNIKMSPMSPVLPPTRLPTKSSTRRRNASSTLTKSTRKTKHTLKDFMKTLHNKNKTKQS